MVRRMTGVIEIEGLRKEYRRLRGGRTIAVDGLDLEVPEGGVFGFLGPNGAGKTTTIRCLLGLVAPSAGTVRLLGSEVPKGLPGVIGKVGAIVETPALFPRFSGRRNLQILARIDGIGKATIEEVLTRVGLADRGDDAVRAYSLGMKQRLGIAAALMKDPQVLVLDEPANGLDPAGIVEVRELVRSLGAEGRTVFISSHILSEIQHTADQVAILAKGRLIKAGPVHEVLVAQRGEGVIVKTKDLQAGLAALTEAGLDVTADPRCAPRRGGARGRRADLAHPRRARPVRDRTAPGRGGPGDRLPGAHRRRTSRPGIRGRRGMIRLLSSETLRFRSRRIVKVLIDPGHHRSRGRRGPGGRGLQQATRATNSRRHRPSARTAIERCVRKDGFHDSFGPRPADQSVQDYCSANIGVSEFISGDPVTLGELGEYVKAAGFIVIVIGLVIGASMVGASWQTGTITTILTWEPRRIRWLLARLVVTAVGVFVVTMVLLAVLAAALALAAVRPWVDGDRTRVARRSAGHDGAHLAWWPRRSR